MCPTVVSTIVKRARICNRRESDGKRGVHTFFHRLMIKEVSFCKTEQRSKGSETMSHGSIC